MATSKHRLCDRFAHRWRCRELHNDSGGSCNQIVHLIPCRKTSIAARAARLYWQHMVKLHGVPRAT